MNTNLWQKLAGMARRGDRVVVVENGEAYVLLPMAEYERLSNGEASLLRVSGQSFSDDVNLPPSDFRPLTSDLRLFDKPSVDEIIEDDLPPIPDLPEAFDEPTTAPAPAATPLASDQLEEEERFYLEPIE